MKILFSGFRYSGHSKFGGYDWISKYPDSDYISDKDCFLGFIPSGKSGKVLNLFFLDRKTRKIAKNYDIVHYFYGDYTIFSNFSDKRKYKIVATIHQNLDFPIPHHRNIIKCLKSTDGVVCLSSQQAKNIRNKYGLNTVFIPHGFNKPSFSYVDVSKIFETFNTSNINVVCIGRQYRDYETLFNIVQSMSNNKSLKFHFIGGDPIVSGKLKNYDNVTVYGRLDDDLYYSLIAQCDYNFMPLTYATANNALMESSYLGIRSILPEISGIVDYACPNENFFYETYDELLNFFSSIKKQVPSNLISSYAEKYSWKNVYKQLGSFYKSL